MERFIEFEDVVSAHDLEQVLSRSNPGIMILRFSKLTGTVKIKIDGRMSKHGLRRAFSPLKIRKVYNHFPFKGTPRN